MTRHSIVRALLLIGWKLLATAKGAADVTMIAQEAGHHRGRGDPGRGHAPRLPRGCGPGPSGQAAGRVERASDREGLRRLLRWAERFGPVRCAGVEGTSSYGAGLARHLRARGIEVLEVERPKHRRRSSRATSRSPTPPTPKPPHGRFWPAKRRACPRAATVRWR